ncbi:MULTISPECIES: GntR family transcriptional regulator [unclassified Saccharopolyspora]|uniref:GntR family transcriptional regulator n=1 Tax=unclassified Saccharopolyspora TaxID=2646250 RepID=UPI001CD4001E|nr:MULTISPECIES: GntR family transcriptional regulator [unclassified Saccharopolyspora]MCA1184994.1 GntR family transcriptional regulator [Saccharopolyspora sp. 6T]MCA1190716.1 GntR family transcriptional regulator [Saccharopolyspora sp. 6V]MCA1225498.1 GntR family transcriptional regulator [Saccharopolyspora sp. 6M]MCA1278180.1 GntR family transcriptional regulator [Saccharopolyspora sp. 7B]
MATSRRIEPTLLTDQVYEFLHDAILNGEFAAGARLRIRDVAAEVGTSVMPVREAIRRLEEAGLVEREPHKGAVVRGLSLEELIHVYEARRVLEVAAARAGAERIDAAGLATMRAEYERMLVSLRERRVVESLDHDEAVLETLYAASGNPVLVQLIRNLWRQCRPYKIVGAQGTVETAADDSLWLYQERLIAAAERHDAEAAATASDESLRDATGRIEALLAAQRSG